MLAIRMQRTGRSGHAQYRVIVQDSRFSPTSGRVVAYLGAYNPHTKETTLDNEKVTTYLKNGAQPSDRVARLLKAQGVKLPDWVSEPTKKEGSIRNAEKLRKNRPAAEPAVEEAPVAPEIPAESPAEETPAAAEPETEAEAETPAEEAPETPEAPAESEEIPEAAPAPETETPAADK